VVAAATSLLLVVVLALFTAMTPRADAQQGDELVAPCLPKPPDYTPCPPPQPPGASDYPTGVPRPPQDTCFLPTETESTMRTDLNPTCNRTHEREIDWDCFVPNGGWCILHVRHSYDYSAARWPYRDNVYVCTKLIRDSNGSDYARACGYRFAGLDTTNNGILLKPLLYQQSGDRNTVFGKAAW